MSSNSEDHERIVYDAKLNFMIAEKRHNHLCGTPEQLEAMASFLIRAVYEVRKGMHEAPPLPRSTWRLSDIADG